MATAFGDKAVQQLRTGLKKLDRLGVPGQSAGSVSRQPGDNRRRVIIVGALAAPTGATPTTGVAAGLRYDPTTKAITATDQRYTIYNWDGDLSAIDGTFAKIEFVDGSWDCYWVGCGAKTGFTGLPVDPGA